MLRQKCLIFLILVTCGLAPNLDASDRTYCEYFLDSPLPHTHFSQVLSLRDILQQLASDKIAQLANAPLSDKLKVLYELKWPMIWPYVKTKGQQLGNIQLSQVAEAYLRAMWSRGYNLSKSQNPRFFADENGQVPRSLEEYLQANLPGALAQLPAQMHVGHQLRMLRSWIPSTPRGRLTAFRLIEDFGGDSAMLAEVVLGGDPIHLQREELSALPNALKNLEGAGSPTAKLSTPFSSLKYLWTQLPLKSGETLVDIGAGLAHPGFSLRAHKLPVRYIGYEIMPSRARMALSMAHTLKIAGSDWQIIQSDVTHPTQELVEGDYYFLFNPLPPSQFGLVLKKLEQVSQQRPFRIVMYWLSLFAEDSMARYPTIAPLMPNRPDWLELEKEVILPNDPDERFFIYRTK